MLSVIRLIVVELLPFRSVEFASRAIRRQFTLKHQSCTEYSAPKKRNSGHFWDHFVSFRKFEVKFRSAFRRFLEKKSLFVGRSLFLRNGCGFKNLANLRSLIPYSENLEMPFRTALWNIAFSHWISKRKYSKPTFTSPFPFALDLSFSMGESWGADRLRLSALFGCTSEDATFIGTSILWTGKMKKRKSKSK